MKRLDRWFYRIVPWNGFLEETYRCLRTEIPRIELELSLSYSLALLGHVLHGWIEVSAAKLRTNYYLLVVGEPATSKTTAWIKLEQNLLKDYVDSDKIFVAHTGASFEGLARVISDYEDVVHFADEVQRIFRHRKGAGYLADIIDLWKMAWNGYPLKLPRRSREKSINIRGGYIFSVIATTTPEDLEDVLEALGDPALIRRFLPVTTNTLARYGEGEPADWTRLKLLTDFTWQISPVHFIVENPKLVPRLTDLAIQSMGIKPGTWLFALIDTYTIKTASLLAWDRLLAYLTGQTRGLKVSSTKTIHNHAETFNTANTLLQRLNSIADTTMRETLIYRTGNVYQYSTPHPPEKHHKETNKIIDIVEELLKQTMISVEVLLKHSKSFVEELLSQLLENVEIPLQPPPQVFWGPGNRLYVWVSDWDLVRGLFITLGIVLRSVELYEYLGMDSRWAYFLRRLRELGRRYDVVDMRVMLQYMRKIGRYSELVDYVYKAVAIGILEPTTSIRGPEDLPRTQFRINVVFGGE